jgi:hypothetical protein
MCFIKFSTYQKRKKKKEKDLIWTYYSAASFIYLTEFNIKTNVSL